MAFGLGKDMRRPYATAGLHHSRVWPVKMWTRQGRWQRLQERRQVERQHVAVDQRQTFDLLKTNSINDDRV